MGAIQDTIDKLTAGALAEASAARNDAQAKVSALEAQCAQLAALLPYESDFVKTKLADRIKAITG